MKSAYLIATLTALAFAPHLAAQQPGAGRREARPPAEEMMQMQRQMDSADARLDSLVTRMNQAGGNQKVTAMAAVINELVAQRRAMRQHMHEMMKSGAMHRRMQMTDSSRAAPGTVPQPARGDTADHTKHHPDR